MKNKVFSVLIGVIIIAIGVGYGMAALGYLEHFTIFIDGWWTIFIVLPGVAMLFSRRSSKFVALCLIALGVALFLRQQEILGDFKKLILPALVIIFGLSVILNALFRGRKKNNTIIPEIPQDGSIPTFETSFGEIKPDYAGKDFTGCSMDVTFGSGLLDLRDARIDKEVTIAVNSAFSGVKIKLPPGCRLDLQTSTSFAGVDNRYDSVEALDAPLVHIIVTVSFGGVDIK